MWFAPFRLPKLQKMSAVVRDDVRFSTHFSIFIIFGHLLYHKVIQDTLLIQKPHYHGQFALSLGKESPLTFSLNSTRLLRTISMVPSVLVLTGFTCNKIHQCFNRMMESTETKAVLPCFPVLRKGHFDLRSYLVTTVNTKWSHDHAGHMISGHVTLCSRHLNKDNYVDVEGLFKEIYLA